jgi:predicted RNase H-like nuclease (RuvC/YqgF family)
MIDYKKLVEEQDAEIKKLRQERDEVLWEQPLRQKIGTVAVLEYKLEALKSYMEDLKAALTRKDREIEFLRASLHEINRIPNSEAAQGIMKASARAALRGGWDD